MDRYGDNVLRRLKWTIAHVGDIEKAVRDKRAEMKRRSGTPEMRSVGYVSDPTEKEAELNLMPIKWVTVGHGIVRRPEEWIAVIKGVYERLSAEDKKLVEVSFWTNSYRDKKLDELNMSKNTFYARREYIVTLFAIKASERRLISLG